MVAFVGHCVEEVPGAPLYVAHLADEGGGDAGIAVLREGGKRLGGVGLVPVDLLPVNVEAGGDGGKRRAGDDLTVYTEAVGMAADGAAKGGPAALVAELVGGVGHTPSG